MAGFHPDRAHLCRATYGVYAIGKMTPTGQQATHAIAPFQVMPKLVTQLSPLRLHRPTPATKRIRIVYNFYRIRCAGIFQRVCFLMVHFSIYTETPVPLLRMVSFHCCLPMGTASFTCLLRNVPNSSPNFSAFFTVMAVSAGSWSSKAFVAITCLMGSSINCQVSPS